METPNAATHDTKPPVSHGLVSQKLAMENIVFGDVPKCTVGEERSAQGLFQESCPCQMPEDGSKYWLRPLRVSVLDQELKGTAVQPCCNERHYVPVRLHLQYRNGVSVEAQLTHSGVTRTVHVEAGDFFSTDKDSEYEEWSLYEQAKLDAFDRIQDSKSRPPKLLCYVKEGQIFVSGVMSTSK